MSQIAVHPKSKTQNGSWPRPAFTPCVASVGPRLSSFAHNTLLLSLLKFALTSLAGRRCLALHWSQSSPAAKTLRQVSGKPHSQISLSASGKLHFSPANERKLVYFEWRSLGNDSDPEGISRCWCLSWCSPSRNTALRCD